MGDFSPRFDVSDSAISRALADLTAAGLITRRKKDNWRMSRATPRLHAIRIALDGSRSS